MTDPKWAQLQWEYEELERQLKMGSHTTPDDQKFGSPVLSPRDQNKIASRMLQIISEQNKFIQDALQRLRG